MAVGSGDENGYLLVSGDVSVVSNNIVWGGSGTSITGTAGLVSVGGSSDDAGSRAACPCVEVEGSLVHRDLWTVVGGYSTSSEPGGVDSLSQPAVDSTGVGSDMEMVGGSVNSVAPAQELRWIPRYLCLRRCTGVLDHGVNT
ncbi:hypothetical protein DVH05_027693 [Phytophthora capsici]|nr:hypothetical protein DVH05_027692 [Phytophthora capsici]KAG1706841.1 hypothetical protein DVH05_027693 [Phytophthora capsici]